MQSTPVRKSNSPVKRLMDRHRELTASGNSALVSFPGIPGHLKVTPCVYNPSLTNVSPLLAKNVPSLEGKVVLDLGTGSGVMGVIAGLRGASKVVMVDKNPAAVACARANAQSHGINHVAIESDLFPPGNERYDYVLFNPPLLDGRPSDALEQAVFDDGRQIIRRFFVRAASRLNPGGRVLLAYTNHKDRNGVSGAVLIRQLSAAHGLAYRVVDRVTRHGETYRIYELRHKA